MVYYTRRTRNVLPYADYQHRKAQHHYEMMLDKVAMNREKFLSYNAFADSVESRKRNMSDINWYTNKLMNASWHANDKPMVRRLGMATIPGVSGFNLLKSNLANKLNSTAGRIARNRSEALRRQEMYKRINFNRERALGLQRVHVYRLKQQKFKR